MILLGIKQNQSFPVQSSEVTRVKLTRFVQCLLLIQTSVWSSREAMCRMEESKGFAGGLPPLLCLFLAL